MAEGWARHLKSDVIKAFSAGTKPHGLDSLAVKAMAEKSVDISNYRSKHLDEVKDIPFNFIITLCGQEGELCPFFPGKGKQIHQGFEDPPRLAENAESEEDALKHYQYRYSKSL